MKHFRTGFLLLLLFLASAFLLSGCKEPVTTIHYYVDGVVADAAPDRNFYDIVSVKSTNPDTNATWNNTTWSLTYTPPRKDTEINIYFEYTEFPFKIDGVGYETLQDAFAAANAGTATTIETTADYSGYAATPVGSDIVLNLNGFTLDGSGFDTIICNGKLIINGEGCITNSVVGEYSKSLVNYGALTVNNVTVTNDTTNVSVWNSNNGGSTMALNNCEITHSQNSIVIINSGEMNLNNCNVTGLGDETHPAIYGNTDISVTNINGGSVINTASGFAICWEAGTMNCSEDCEMKEYLRGPE